jgi:hypothetical protein
VRERPWYVAAVAPPNAVELPQTSLPVRSPSSPRVLRACEQIDPSNLIRMRGDFGRFQGFAGVVGPEGMDGLRSEMNGSGSATGAVTTGLVTLDRIHRVEKHGHSIGKGALFGGVLIGCLGGMVGAAATRSRTEPRHGTAFFEGVLAGGAVGAGLGGLIGAAIPGWHLVYRR